MTYQASEISVSDSKPIELYDLADAFGTHWRYTSSTDEQTLLSYTYSPKPIVRSAIRLTGNHFKDTLDVKLERNNVFAIQYIAGPPESKITLAIYRMQGIDYSMYWSGIVAQVIFDSKNIPTLKCIQETSESPYTGSRRRCQIGCPLVFGGTGIGECNVNREAFKVTGTITSVSGVTIISSAFSAKANDWFTGGEIVVGNARRLITSHTTNTITIARPFLNIEAGNSFTAYAGCFHRPVDCGVGKFNNKPNYGGDEFLPIKNPFSSNISNNSSQMALVEIVTRLFR